jgi:hypothetical protein
MRRIELNAQGVGLKGRGRASLSQQARKPSEIFPGSIRDVTYSVRSLGIEPDKCKLCFSATSIALSHEETEQRGKLCKPIFRTQPRRYSMPDSAERFTVVPLPYEPSQHQTWTYLLN